jgi:hypothetical protein
MVVFSPVELGMYWMLLYINAGFRDVDTCHPFYPLGRDFVTRFDTISAVSGHETGVLGESVVTESRLSG